MKLSVALLSFKVAGLLFYGSQAEEQDHVSLRQRHARAGGNDFARRMMEEQKNQQKTHGLLRRLVGNVGEKEATTFKLESLLGKGLDAAPGTDLNTRGRRETHEQRLRRLQGPQGPPEQDANIVVNPFYNPMVDAKCFNDDYHPPSIDKHDLYNDFKKMFDWGLQNPVHGILFAQSQGVSSNRFPAMCWRMAFHDNTIVGESIHDYALRHIDPNTKKWTGPYTVLPTSGLDASVLTCTPERLHPNNNYDQTASRVLHGFQTDKDYPDGPGIKDSDGNPTSLKSKYGLSYADLLHSCAVAATRYMIDATHDATLELEINVTVGQKADLYKVVDTMDFGRKDACYVSEEPHVLADPLVENNRHPLCGPSDILPNVGMKADEINRWFEGRGMKEGAWMSMFGTHTTFDNFMDPKHIRNVGIPGKDYFEDFVGCPYHELLARVNDPEVPGCTWTPVCHGQDGTPQTWRMAQSDCATGIDIISNSSNPDLVQMTNQMQTYIDSPGSWLPDFLCALRHLGGRKENCVGPNAHDTTVSESLFGSCFTCSLKFVLYDGTSGEYLEDLYEAGRFGYHDGDRFGIDVIPGDGCLLDSPSVHIELQGPYFRDKIENVPPYQINEQPLFQAGYYTLTATLHSERDGGGYVVTTHTMNFEFYEYPPPGNGDLGLDTQIITTVYQGLVPDMSWASSYSVGDRCYCMSDSLQGTIHAGPTLWKETFDDQANGATYDTGDTAWTLTQNSHNFYVQGGKLVMNDGGSEGYFITEEIDITGKTVEVSLDLYSNNQLEIDQDYVKLYYKVNNGPEMLIGEKKGIQSTPTTIKTPPYGITGNTLKLVIRAKVTWYDEFYYMDNLSVTTLVDSSAITAWTPFGNRTLVEICNLIGSGPGPWGRPVYNDIQCGRGPPMEENEQPGACPGRVDNGAEGCDHLGPLWNWDGVFENGVAAETCVDGIWNQDETGVDCGGNICDACPTCDDNLHNGDESGIDCGGSCPDACGPASCNDGVQNGEETGVDCGGPICEACPDPAIPPSCSNLIQDGDETGIDCGGSCSPCTVLDVNNPVGIPGTCESPGNEVDGYPCSAHTVQLWGETFTSTDSFNPGIKQSLGTVNRTDGHSASVYEYDVVNIEANLFDSILNGSCVNKPTKLMSYGGFVPAETMHVTSGQETYVRFNNKIAEAPRPEMFDFEGCNPDHDGKTGVPFTVHNHGQASLAPFDGYAEDRTCFNESKAYMYPNNRPTTGWFHDHALHQTGANVLFGLYGFYIIHEKTSLGGCGEPYNLDDMEEVYLLLNDVVIDNGCQIHWDVEGAHLNSYFGDINLVNGHPFPVLAGLDRKWYRLRVLDAAVSRPFLLRLVTPGGQDVSSSLCQIIGSDGGYFERGPQPFPDTGLMVGVAERWDVVCDFGSLDPSIPELILYNDFDPERMKHVPYFTYSHFIAKFTFTNGVVTGNPPVFDPNIPGNIGNFVPKTVLEKALPEAITMATNGDAHRVFDFGRGNGHWVINGETWVTDRVAANDVGQNTWEVWEIDTGGGWFHPVHIHLIDFFILARKGADGVFSPDIYGRAGAPKDVMYLGPGETIWVVARWGPHKGEFMFHCHNLRHEDNDMLRTFITINNNATHPGGPNAGNDDRNFTEVNGIIYDNYLYGNPTGSGLQPFATAGAPSAIDHAQEFLNKNFYRIFYPLPNDTVAVLNNPWLASNLAQCA